MDKTLHSSGSEFIRIAKNAISLLSEGVIARLSNFIFSLVLVRHLTIFDYGFYSAIISFIAISCLLTEFGMSPVLVRDIAQNKSRSAELFSGAICICLSLFVIIVPVTIIAAALAGYSQSFICLLAFSTIAIVGNSLVLFAGAVLRAHEQMVSLSLMNSIVVISSAVIGILWIHFGAGIHELIFLFVATPTINSLTLIFYIRRHYARFSLAEGLMAWKSLFRKAVPLAIFNLLGIIVLRFDILLISMTAGMNDTGIYSAARNITDTLSLFIQGFIGAVFPFIAIKWKESAMTAVKSYEHTLRLLTIFGMAAAVGIYMLADKIIVLLYSAKYLESAVCLKILIWSFMLTALGGPVSMILIITEDRLKHYIPYALGVTAMSVILNIWLTPQYGYYSASCIAVLSSLCAFILRLTALGNLLPIRPQWFSISWRPIVASIIMGLSIRQIGDLSLSVLIPFGFVTYMIALLALGEFAKEYRMFMNRLRTPVP